MSNIPESGLRPDSLLQANFLSPEPTGNEPVRATTPQPSSSIPARATSPQPSINLPTREQLIKAMKQRQREQREEDFDEMDAETSVEYTPPPRRVSVLRPNRRRSKSTGDAMAGVDKNATRKRAETVTAGTSGMLDNLGIEEEDLLADSIDRELRRLKGPNHTVGISSPSYVVLTNRTTLNYVYSLFFLRNTMFESDLKLFMLVRPKIKCLIQILRETSTLARHGVPFAGPLIWLVPSDYD